MKPRPNEYTEFMIVNEFPNPDYIKTYHDKEKHLYFEFRIVIFERLNNSPYWTLVCEKEINQYSD